MNGFTIDYNRATNDNISFGTSISYWFDSFYENLGPNYSLQINYFLENEIQFN